MIGRTLQHYRILSQLGVGGMGQVYLAEDTKLGRKVALKVLTPETASDPLRLKRLQREARAVASLNHPNIVTVHAVEEAEGLHFFTMELVEGESLGSLMGKARITTERVVSIGEAIAAALSAAHQNHITHQDLKPANIMISEDGLVKVLDFGLAKHRPPASADGPKTQTVTEEGKVYGTLQYMAPEQLAGQRGDPRSDIFALGLILYEMATGKQPFSGRSWPDVVSAIIRDQPPSVSDLNKEVPVELAELIAKCLEKNPEDRFQTAEQLFAELQMLRKSFELSQSEGKPLTRPASRRQIYVVWTLAGLLILAGGYLMTRWLGGGETGETRVALPDSGKPSIAVLHTLNRTGDASFDWLRIGLADMLVTGLAQSPALEVLSTDRMYQILQDLKKLDTRGFSADDVREIARRGGVDTVLIGTFMKLHVKLQVQEARSSKILHSIDVNGDAETGLFDIADTLSRRVLDGMQIAVADRDAVRRLQEVTTDSVEAYRYYVEGRKLSLEIKYDEALSLLERAVEIDPDFAMAHVEIGIIHQTLDHERESREATERAFAARDQLSPYERLYVEGRYYGDKWATYDRAIEAYEKAVELGPERAPARYDLMLLYTYTERYREMVDEAAELQRWGHTFAGREHALANSYVALGDFESGFELLDEFVRENQESWGAHITLGWHLIHWGKLDEAIEAYDAAEARRGGEAWLPFGRWRIHRLRDDGAAAEQEALELARSEKPALRWRGLMHLAWNRLYSGEIDDALRVLDEAADIYGEKAGRTAFALGVTADLLLQMDQETAALVTAERAANAAPGEWPEREGWFQASLAHQAMGSEEEARQLLEQLRSAAGDDANVVEQRQVERLEGLLALSEGDAARAIDELMEAEALLSERGIRWHPLRLADHVPMWYELGMACEAAGRTDCAIEWYARVAESGFEHLEFPVRYIRSFYRLGKLHEQRGDKNAARDHFARFAEYWKNGDTDRDAVAYAARAAQP